MIYRIPFFVTTLLLCSIGVISKADSDTNAAETAGYKKYSPMIVAPVGQFDTSNQTTNSKSSYEEVLSSSIEETKLALQQTNLNPIYRQSLERLLRVNESKLSDYSVHVKKQHDFLNSVKANPQTAWTNLPDPVQAALESDVKQYQGELANPSLTPEMRRTYEAMLSTFQEKLADHQTNAQLWANLRLATQNQNQEKMILAKKQLANYLAVQLGKIQGKTYPSNMSLEAVMEEYKKQVGYSHWYENQSIIRGILFVCFILPPAIMISVVIKRRFLKPSK